MLRVCEKGGLGQDIPRQLQMAQVGVVSETLPISDQSKVKTKTFFLAYDCMINVETQPTSSHWWM